MKLTFASSIIFFWETVHAKNSTNKNPLSVCLWPLMSYGNLRSWHMIAIHSFTIFSQTKLNILIFSADFTLKVLSWTCVDYSVIFLVKCGARNIENHNLILTFHADVISILLTSHCPLCPPAHRAGTKDLHSCLSSSSFWMELQLWPAERSPSSLSL